MLVSRAANLFTLWRSQGLSPAVTQAAPYSALAFCSYELVRRLVGVDGACCVLGVVLMCTLTLLVRDASDMQSESLRGTASAMVGGVAGTAAKLVVYPFDVAKRRLQVQQLHVCAVGCVSWLAGWLTGVLSP